MLRPLIAFLTLSTAQATSDFFNYELNFQNNAMQLLSDFAGVQNGIHVGELILDHGCHCARLDPFANKAILGGDSVVDQLDEICKQWVLMRACNDLLSGGTCQNVPVDFYTYVIEKPETLQFRCLDPQADPYQDCKRDACKVDLFFVNEILDFFGYQVGSNGYYESSDFTTGNLNWTSVIATPTTCPQQVYRQEEKYCSGEAPNFRFNNYEIDSLVKDQQQYEPQHSFAELVILCQDAIFDLTILVDGSGSVSSQDYEQIITFVINLIQHQNSFQV